MMTKMMMIIVEHGFTSYAQGAHWDSLFAF